MVYPAFQPGVSAWFTLFVPPHTVADIYAIVILDSPVAYITVIFFELLKERLLKVSYPAFIGHCQSSSSKDTQ
jgi:hypothetical protein